MNSIVFHLAILGDNTPIVFKYHQICRDASSHLCLHDSNYLCMCQGKQTQVDCFNYNPLIDRCDSCLSDGTCVQGDRQGANDFICLCPYCYSGRLCEFSMQPFTFTLDSLLVFERFSTQILYICVVFVLFLAGFVNNCCSFATFRRGKPRKVSVGNWLFVVTLLNQFALLFLLIKFIHVFLGSWIGWSNNESCKSINYLLVIFTRATYWLTSWITIDRLLIAIFPTLQIIKSPRTAIWSSAVTCISISALHIHEILFTISIRQPDSIISLCVVNFQQQPTMVEYNRVSTLLHYVIPFLLQAISITLLIVLAARQRAKTKGTRTSFCEVLNKQFTTQKELYLTPAIIVLSALPQAIFSFSLTCTPLISWQRHGLLVTYLLSYTPQALSFLVHVMPSTAYKQEYYESSLAKMLKRCFRCTVKRVG